MAKNNPTTDEHYIPQFYLKNFSQDGKRIYQYDVLTGIQTSNPVAIRKICFEKNLYEFKNDSGDFLNRNLIEKWLSIYEGEFAKVFRSIQSKTGFERNYYTLSFLSLKEKAFIVFFITTLLVRNPEHLKIAQETAIELFEGKVSKNSAMNYALQMCLPIYNKINAEDKNLLNSVMRLFEDMSFQIGVADSEVLLTSDFPVVLYGTNHPTKIDEVIMPISSKIALYMKPYANTRRMFYNRLTGLCKEDIQYVNRSIITHCNRWIYSKVPFTDKQIEWINEERSK